MLPGLSSWTTFAAAALQKPVDVLMSCSSQLGRALPRAASLPWAKGGSVGQPVPPVPAAAGPRGPRGSGAGAGEGGMGLLPPGWEKPGVAAAVGRVSLAGCPRQNRWNFVLSLDLWCLSQVVGGLALQKRKVHCHSHPALASLTLNKGQK